MSNRSDLNRGSGPNGRKKKYGKGTVILTIVLVAVLAAVAVGVGFFSHYYGLTEYEGDKDTTTQSVNSASLDVESTGLSDSEASDIQKQNAKAASEAKVEKPAGIDVYNLLLVGVDRRNKSWNGNSDVMILCSINNTTKKITLMSFMRDLYADIPGHGVRKLNAACAYGGCDLLIETLKSNYRVDIDNYAWVDFESMISIVDAAGGTDLTLSDAEAQVANKYINAMCSNLGRDASQEHFPGGGSYHCDGMQTVAYARIRYVGNADFERTARQREVLTQLMQTASDMSLSELNSFAETVLPLVHHDISSSTVLSLLSSAPTILQYDVVQSRVPYDDHYTSVKEILNPDMAYTIERIQEDLYGDGTESAS